MLLENCTTKFNVNGNKTRYSILSHYGKILAVYSYDYNIIDDDLLNRHGVEVIERMGTIKEFNQLTKNKSFDVYIITKTEQIIEDL